MTNGIGDYSVEIDFIDEASWGELLPEYADASFRQTWSEGVIGAGEGNLSHLILKRGDDIVAMAQISIRKLPLIKAGIATLYWGPLWRKKGRSVEYVILDKMIKALKNEYVEKRGSLLRIWPVGYGESEQETASILEKYGFIRNEAVQQYRTLLLDLSPSMEELRKNLDQKWRNQLNVAEKKGLNISVGTSDEMFNTFMLMLTEMLARKKFTPGVEYARYKRLQSVMPEHLKMKVFVCESEGEPVASGVFTAIGGTGTYLLGASSDKGMKLNGSNLIHWGVIKWLKELGCQWYDLGGIDPAGNPGVYHFKRGIGGKTGKEVLHLGQFYLAGNPMSCFLNVCINRINDIRAKERK